MLFLHDYIKTFKEEDLPNRAELADILDETKSIYDVFRDGNPVDSFEIFVERYNWLGSLSNKKIYGIDSNLARNLPGALMQDWILNLVFQLCEPYPQIDVFTEVRVSFGRYPIWKSGRVAYETPSEKSDIAIGYLTDASGTEFIRSVPKKPYYGITRNQSVLPLATVNTKIRVSQSEFFDWLGREQLMTKGNPHCLSVQVALRKEMDMSIVDAAQARDKFFLLGSGTERTVVPDRSELTRFIHTFSEHLTERMA